MCVMSWSYHSMWARHLRVSCQMIRMKAKEIRDSRDVEDLRLKSAAIMFRRRTTVAQKECQALYRETMWRKEHQGYG